MGKEQHVTVTATEDGIKTDKTDLNDVVPDGTHKEDWKDVGFLAQDVEKLEEEYGHKMSDKSNLTTTLSTDGKQYGLTYAKFVPILTKAIQELSAEIEILKAYNNYGNNTKYHS